MREPSNEWIKKSWERSLSYDVDGLKAQDYILRESAFKEYKENNRLFLRKSTPFIERLSNWLKSNSSMVAILDSSGYLLESSGDPYFLEVSEKLSIHNGACWSEKIQGTNAVGIVLAEKRPLAVIGEDYFLPKNRQLYGVAAPVFDAYGDLQGVFDIIGYHQKYHPSLLATVDIISRNIENQLLFNSFDRKIVISLQPEQGFTGNLLIAVNEDGIIIGMNREAREHFIIDSLKNRTIQLSDLITDSKQLLERKTDFNPNVLTLRNKITGETVNWEVSILMDTRPMYTSLPIGTNSSLKTKKPTNNTKYTFSDIYCNDKKLRETILLANRAATTNYTIMINGESGTGKEMFSQAIHNASFRSNKPFIAINCGAVPKNLLESELFGYEAGAFTGASKSGHPGKFELADGGTLFLDEIAEMPPEMQVALLRVLQDFTVTRIGGTKPIRVDTRIIVATHQNLWEKVQEGSFRADLYYRLQGVNIKIPSIRERSDRLNLAKHLLKDLEFELQMGTLKLSPSAESLIERFPWQGNVRQLIGALREASFLSDGDVIELKHFSEYIVNQFNSKTDKAISILEESERDKIIETLNRTEGNISNAARILGIGRNTLYRKIKKLNL